MADDQKTALVTGGNTGIGLAVARQLGALGLRVIISARSQEKADQALSDLKSGGVEAAIDDIIARYGCIDVLVNNAGVLLEGIEIGRAHV